MISIQKLKQLIEGFQQVEKHILVRTESEMQQKIEGIDEWTLVMVVPSADTKAFSSDNIRETEQCIAYIIEKSDRGNEDDTDVINAIDEAQQKMMAFKLYLYDISISHDHPLHKICKQIDFNTFHTDPEYNYFGCDGYSLSFVLQTDWF